MPLPMKCLSVLVFLVLLAPSYSDALSTRPQAASVVSSPQEINNMQNPPKLMASAIDSRQQHHTALWQKRINNMPRGSYVAR